MYNVKEMIFISPLKKNLIRYAVYVALFTTALIVFFVPHYIIDRSNRYLTERLRFPTDLKYILFWKPPKTKFDFNRQEFKFPQGQEIFITQKCKFINCFVTRDEKFLREDHRNFDAVVFSVHDVTKVRTRDVNLSRSPHQNYIFYSHESAAAKPLCNPAFDGFFNWTWTYKLDSDIVHPFFNIYDAKNVLVGPAKNMNWVSNMKHEDRFSRKIATKSKAVAVIVSKCSSKLKHKTFIRELREELQRYNHSLDLYGPCGDIKCPRNRLTKCYELIEKTYFFQIVLEDFIAKDYVTEKIEKAMTHLVIPIVLGGLDYTSFMPPGSYIDSQHLTMKKLGSIINYLITNPRTYEYFFDWKNYYFYTPKSRSFLCDLCAKLNSNYSVSTHKSYDKFREWWDPNYKDSCRKQRSRYN